MRSVDGVRVHDRFYGRRLGRPERLGVSPGEVVSERVVIEIVATEVAAAVSRADLEIQRRLAIVAAVVVALYRVAIGAATAVVQVIGRGHGGQFGGLALAFLFPFQTNSKGTADCVR